ISRTTLPNTNLKQMLIRHAHTHKGSRIGHTPRASTGTIETENNRVAIMKLFIPVDNRPHLRRGNPRITSVSDLVQKVRPRHLDILARVPNLSDQTIQIYMPRRARR